MKGSMEELQKFNNNDINYFYSAGFNLILYN